MLTVCTTPGMLRRMRIVLQIAAWDWNCRDKNAYSIHGPRFEDGIEHPTRFAPVFANPTSSFHAQGRASLDSTAMCWLSAKSPCDKTDIPFLPCLDLHAQAYVLVASSIPCPSLWDKGYPRHVPNRPSNTAPVMSLSGSAVQRSRTGIIPAPLRTGCRCVPTDARCRPKAEVARSLLPDRTWCKPSFKRTCAGQQFARPQARSQDVRVAPE